VCYARRVTAAPLIIGLALGMRHALEPDHLAALSTLATEERGGARSSFGLGALWGLGHTLALLLVGGTLAVLGAQMPANVEHGLEFIVSLMVIGLGVRAVLKSIREGREGQVHPHRHGEQEHVHAAPVDHIHLRRSTLATRPLLIGVMHGLAGSGALTALVLAELPTMGARLSYIALFGGGSVLGMGLLTGLAGMQVSKLVRTPQLASALLFLTGVGSTCVGLWWGRESLQHLLG
jgi:ABC-type nickel/cobalt efflux system permease component RcnA